MQVSATSNPPFPAAARRPAVAARCALVLLAALWLALPAHARAGAPPQVDAPVLQNLFPRGLAFAGRAFSPDGTITGATLHYRLAGSDSVYHVPLTVSPADQIKLYYYWDTRAEGVPPGARVSAYWEVSDARGRPARGAETTFTYEDTRFAWQVTQNERAAVWWHDAPASLGRLALDIAGQALEYQQRIYGSHPTYPIRITLYNTQAEFSAWQPDLPPFVGAAAYPPLGVTALAARDGPARETWLRAAIPHELARLHFHAAAYHPLNPAPRWLDEGLALYTEFTDHRAEEQAVQMAALRGGLIPLRGLLTDFGPDEARVRLAQAEGLSAVRYLMQTQGPEKLVALLRAYHDGAPTVQAFGQVLGRQPEQFEDDWLIWLGMPKAWRPTPRPWPTPGTAAGPSSTATTVTFANAATAAATPVPIVPTPHPAGPQAAPGLGVSGGLLGLVLLPALAIVGISCARSRAPGDAGRQRRRPPRPRRH